MPFGQCFITLWRQALQGLQYQGRGSADIVAWASREQEIVETIVVVCQL